ncbi:unnamed protein product [Brassica rapa]|uniref:GTP cyclohydrolase 1 n=1 Tax=Brassica campestris TaxID=3711 RepID=A0A8D9DRV0_BRACM|nr:unnamed protein product [Brassica rapa]
MSNGYVKQWCPSIKSSSEQDPEMVSAVVSILKSLGEDLSREGLVTKPAKFLKWMMNFENANLEMKLNCANAVKANREVKEKKLHCELNIPFWSMCEHHLLPFYGIVHIVYYCADGYNHKTLMKSIVHFYGFKLQVQERMTRQSNS